MFLQRPSILGEIPHMVSGRTVCTYVGRDSSVGIATRHRLDGPGIESRWGRDFPHPSRPALGPTQPPVQWVPDFLPGVKRPGRGVDHPLPFSVEVKEQVELYLYSPYGPSWPVLWWTLLLPLPYGVHILRNILKSSKGFPQLFQPNLRLNLQTGNDCFCQHTSCSWRQQ